MPYLYVIRTPSGLRKIGYSTSPKRRAVELGAHNTIGERGAFTLEYERECPAPVKDAESHAHAVVQDALVKYEYFAIDLETARAAVDAAIDAMPLPTGEPEAQERMVKITIRCSPELADAVNDWRRRQTPIPSTSDALRALADIGLSA